MKTEMKNEVQIDGVAIEVLLAWAAGFIDAEGCIRITRYLVKDKQRWVYQVCLTVSQNCCFTLGFLQQVLNCGGSLDQGRVRGNSLIAVYSLQYSSQMAVTVLRRLLPYLQRKRAEAELAIEFDHECEMGNRGRRLSCPIVTARRDSYYLKMQSLKLSNTAGLVDLSGTVAIAWAAGFVDGDGCISIKKGRDDGDYHLRLQITQNNLAVLETFRRVVGGGGYLGKKDSRWAKSAMYSLLFASERARQVIEEITPFLVRKRGEAELALDFCENCRIGYRGLRRVPKGLIARRHDYKVRLSEMKNRPTSSWPPRCGRAKSNRRGGATGRFPASPCTTCRWLHSNGQTSQDCPWCHDRDEPLQ